MYNRNFNGIKFPPFQNHKYVFNWCMPVEYTSHVFGKVIGVKNVKCFYHYVVIAEKTMEQENFIFLN